MPVTLLGIVTLVRPVQSSNKYDLMLVMLLGQTRVLYSMANDGLLPRKFFAAVHPKYRTPWKNTILVGILAQSPRAEAVGPPIVPNEQFGIDFVSAPGPPIANQSQRYTETALACFERIQTLLRGKPHGKVHG